MKSCGSTTSDDETRNLCATGVYVGHVGSRSFRTDKRRLVMRNLATLEQRFPGCTSESLPFSAPIRLPAIAAPSRRSILSGARPCCWSVAKDPRGR